MMLREIETGDLWQVIEWRKHLLVVKRNNDGLLRIILNDNPAYKVTNE